MSRSIIHVYSEKSDLTNKTFSGRTAGPSLGAKLPSCCFCAGEGEANSISVWGRGEARRERVEVVYWETTGKSH